MTDILKNRIEETLGSAPIVLFMKGVADMPACGFSAQVVDVLRAHDVDFRDINILEDNELREGLKEYADWPTFPQLWVGSKLIGGCDIVLDMHEAGELDAALKGSS